VVQKWKNIMGGLWGGRGKRGGQRGVAKVGGRKRVVEEEQIR